MRVEMDLEDDTRDAVKAYADREGYQMSRAYAELINQMLTLSVYVEPRGDDFAVGVETDSWSSYIPIDSGLSEKRLVSAEYAPAWDGWQDDV